MVGDDEPPRARVLIVMGVSGSGKTTIAKALARRLHAVFADGDGFHPVANVETMRAGIPLTDEDRGPWLRAIAAWIEERLASGERGIVACSALRRAYRAVLVGSHGDEVRLVHLDGDRPLIASRLAGRRGHYMPPSLLDSQLQTLEPPDPDERAVVVANDRAPRIVVDAILGALRA